MGRNERRRRAGARDGAHGAQAVAGAAPPAAAPRSPGWLASKGPALRFVLISASLMALFYAVFYTSPEDSPAIDRFIRGYLGAYAAAGAFVLDLVGMEARAQGTTLFLGTRAVEVVRGCDAMEPIAFFIAAVLAVQVPWRWKLVGLGAGVSALVLLNLVRIMLLAVVSAKLPEVFETAHVTIAQTVFVVCTLCLWFLWMARAPRDAPGGA